MTTTSEWVSPGHPDKVADLIASYILDRYLEKDPQARVALEVQIKGRYVTVSGEVTSTVDFPSSTLKKFVREAVNRIGYTKQYQRTWGEDNTICGDDLDVTFHITRQSPEIAKGVDADGWGDQGIFFGMATSTESCGAVPLDFWLARQIGMELFSSGMGGLDIKVQVTVEDNRLSRIIVAIPVLTDVVRDHVESFVRELVEDDDDCEVVVNGTGVFRCHGPVADCGTTGRKLAVDFYGGNCRIGGGSPWGKDPTKADVTLNVLARRKALQFQKLTGMPRVYCAISCCIGRRDIRVTYMDAYGREVFSCEEHRPAGEVIEELGLRSPKWFDRCRLGIAAV